MKALVSSSHHILWGMIGIGFWQSFSKAKSTLPLHCVKISIAFNVVASRVAKNNIIANFSTCTFRLPARTSKQEVGYFSMKPTIFWYQMMGIVSQSTQNLFFITQGNIWFQKIAGSMAKKQTSGFVMPTGSQRVRHAYRCNRLGGDRYQEEMYIHIKNRMRRPLQRRFLVVRMLHIKMLV